MKRIPVILLCLLAVGFTACNSGSVKSTTTTVANDASKPKSETDELEAKVLADSTNIEVRTLLATKYYTGGILDKAAYHFIIIYQQDTNNLNALVNLGNIYYDSQQNEKAIEFYEKALRNNSNNINLRCDLATCYSNVTEHKKAIDMLRGNIKIDPRHAKSHYNLSVILKRTGDDLGAAKEMKEFELLNKGQ